MFWNILEYLGIFWNYLELAYLGPSAPYARPSGSMVIEADERTNRRTDKLDEWTNRWTDKNTDRHTSQILI